MRIITGKVRGLKLTVPKDLAVRPTTDRVKESLFNIIGTKIIGAKVLDLFAGTGNLGLEAWSRGADISTIIYTNIESLRL
ncbi:MAG: RsmD family RNA methyltransferase, partial [Acidaminococcaceae bacterium]